MSIFRAYTACGALIAEVEYSDAAASDAEKIQELLGFVAWCVLESNQADTIAGNLLARLHLHRVDVQSCSHLRRILTSRCKGLHGRMSPQGSRRRFCRTSCWEDRARLPRGTPAAELFICLSRWEICV